MQAQRTPTLVFGSVLLLVLLAWSGTRPYDRATWAMEVAPVAIALPVLWATYRRFPLTSLLYFFILVHAGVLMLGGAYTYARVPLGFQIQEVLGLQRNPYDRIGHFFQGFVPALVAREILIRGSRVRGRGMLAFVVVCIVLAVSATYEFVEWGAALALGQGADEFLGTQGDPWDTQSDMFMALVGAVAALVLLSRLHDRQIGRLRTVTPPRPSMSIDPARTYLSLAADGSAVPVAGGEAFWSRPPSELDRSGRCWLVSEFEFSSDWSNWEMHPHADEFVYLLAGRVVFLLEGEAGVTRLPLEGRGALVVPRGVWHTAEVSAPSRMLFVTLGEGTRHRPAGPAT